MGLRKEAARTAQKAELAEQEKSKRDGNTKPDRAAVIAEAERARVARAAEVEDRKSALAEILQREGRSTGEAVTRKADPPAAPAKPNPATAQTAQAQPPQKSPSADVSVDQLLEEFSRDRSRGSNRSSSITESPLAASTASEDFERPVWARSTGEETAGKRTSERPTRQFPAAEPKTEALAATRTGTDESSVANPFAASTNGPIPRLTREDLRTARSTPDPVSEGVARTGSGISQQTVVPTSREQVNGRSDSRDISRASGASTETPRTTKLRVQSLMSEAHTSMVRGDWYAAYRSALLAQQEAVNRKIEFGPQEERPDQLVNELATRLWGNPNLRPPIADETGTTLAGQNPPARPASSRTGGTAAGAAIRMETATIERLKSPHDVFGTTADSEWVPVGDNKPSAITPASSLVPAAGSRDPWAPQREASTGADSQSFSGENKSSLPALPNRTSSNVSWPLPSEIIPAAGSVSAETVKVARSEVVEPAPAWEELRQPRELKSEDHTAATPPRRHQWATEEHVVTVVAARDVEPSGLELSLATTTVGSSAPAELPLVAASNPATTEQLPGSRWGNMPWAIAGFLAALAATVIGLRARRLEEDEDAA